MHLLSYTAGGSLACQSAHPSLRYATEALQYLSTSLLDHGESKENGSAPFLVLTCDCDGAHGLTHNLTGTLDTLAASLTRNAWWLLRHVTGPPENGVLSDTAPVAPHAPQRPIPLCMDVVADREGCSSLKRLRVLLKHLSGLASVLKVLRIGPQFVSIDAASARALAMCTSLTSLTLRTAVIEDYTPLQSMALLTELRLENLRIDDTRTVAGLRSLPHPQVSLSLRPVATSDIRDVADIPALTELDLGGNTTLADLGVMRGALPHIRSLQLQRCPLIHDFSPLANLKSLHSLDVSHNAQLQTINWLGLSTVLRILDLSGCRGLEDIAPLRYLRSTLTHLWLASTAVEDLSTLAVCEQLQLLDVSGCWRLTSLQPLGLLPLLHTVDASRSGIKDVDGLAGSGSLEILRLLHCKQLQDLSPLGTVANLRQLAGDGSDIRRVDGLARLVGAQKLQLLSLRNCYKVQDWSAVAALRACGTVVVAPPQKGKESTAPPASRRCAA